MYKYTVLFTPLLMVIFTLSFASDVHAAKFFGVPFPMLSDINQVKKAKAQDVEVPPTKTAPVPENKEKEDAPKDFVDPQEIKNEIRQTNEQLKQVNQVIATAKRLKATEAVAELEAIKKQLTEFSGKLKALKSDSENARDVLEEYREAQLWEKINVIRRKIELPKELKEMNKRIIEAEKLLGNKQVLSALTALGGDSEKLKAVVATMKTAYTKAQEAFNGGDGELAEEELQDIRENGHPGELTGILNGMRQFGGRLRSVKDAEIRDMIKEIIEPIIEALNEGDIREARMTIDELGPEIERTMQKAMKLSSKNRKVFVEGLDKLEQRINEKLEQEGSKNEKPEKED